MLYGDSCLVVVRRDNGYPLLVFGHDQRERAEHICRVNGCDLVRCVLVRCVPEQAAEAKEGES